MFCLNITALAIRLARVANTPAAPGVVAATWSGTVKMGRRGASCRSLYQLP